MTWTVERVDDLARFWSQGLSARKIADKLGGVTRNAVIGKAHRLNLQRGVEDVEPIPEPPPPIPIEPIFAPMPEAKSWMCRWPLDDPGRFGLHICGKTAQPGRHYCAEHLTVAYLMRRRRAA